MPSRRDCVLVYFLVGVSLVPAGKSRTLPVPAGKSIREAGGRWYDYLSYSEIVTEMHALALSHPELARVWSTQDRYGLPSAGQCPSTRQPTVPCLTWVLEVTHFPTLGRHPGRPDVLVSGALHGDERVGPAVTLELAKWLVLNFSHDNWAHRLVSGRRMLLIPMTNAVGYAMHTREELGRDPNRDFPFQQAAPACMTTVTARSLNELFRANLIQVALTFHAGMEAVGYVWGDFAHRGGRTASRSPDHSGISSLGRAASLFASSGKRNRAGEEYPSAPMNSIVYPVQGGMEDWAYAASWDLTSVKGCRPSTFGGYKLTLTQSYSDSAARAAVLLIETSDDKSPRSETLGGSAGMLSPGADADGHIPRNVRLAVAAIDLAQPHVEVVEGGKTVAAGKRLVVEAHASARVSAFRAPQSPDGRVHVVQVIKRALANAAFTLSRTLRSERSSSTADTHLTFACAAGLRVKWRVWGAVHADETFPVWLLPNGSVWKSAAAAQSGEPHSSSYASPYLLASQQPKCPESPSSLTNTLLCVGAHWYRKYVLRLTAHHRNASHAIRTVLYATTVRD